MVPQRQAALLNLLGLVGIFALVFLVAREVVVDGPRRVRLENMVESHERAAALCRTLLSEKDLDREFVEGYQALAEWHLGRSQELRRAARPDLDEEERQIAVRANRLDALSSASSTATLSRMDAEMETLRAETEAFLNAAERLSESLREDSQLKPRFGGRVRRLLYTPSPDIRGQRLEGMGGRFLR